MKSHNFWKKRETFLNNIKYQIMENTFATFRIIAGAYAGRGGFLGSISKGENKGKMKEK